MADVTKELKIQLTADDKTAGTWDKLKDNASGMAQWFTPLNQAWELGAKLWGVLADNVGKGIEALSRGGDLNETTSAFDAMSAATKLGGDAMVDKLQELTIGVLGVDKAMKVASQSMAMGFSSDQAGVIATFAKRYSEATGESLEAVIDKIQRAIATGRGLERLNMFGLNIEKADTMAEKMGKIEEATKKYGEGAFSFRDQWNGVKQSMVDALDVTAMWLNRVMEDDLPGLALAFRESMGDIVNVAPSIAVALWIPIKEIGNMVDYIFGGFSSMGEAIITFALTAGNTFFDLTKLFGKLGESVAWTADKFYALNETIAWARGNDSLVEYIQKKRTEWAEYGAGLANLDEAQKEWNDSILNSRTLEENSTATRLEHRKATKLLGEEVGKITEKVAVETAAIEKNTKANKKALTEYEARVERYRSLGLEYQQTGGGTGAWWTPIKEKKPKVGQGDESGLEGSSAGMDRRETDSEMKVGKIQLIAPPGDDLLAIIVDYLNQAIRAEGTVGAGF